MSRSAVDTIAAVRAFLTERVLPGVAEAHRGELRAALKLLRDVERELAESPDLAAGETDELREICDRAAAALGRPVRSHPVDHEAARVAAEQAVVALQAQVRAGGIGGDVLGDLYATLGRHAERRAPWQSVFKSRREKDA